LVAFRLAHPFATLATDFENLIKEELDRCLRAVIAQIPDAI